ncbi:uncharacterized [Tachysurus ichikawai]
MVRIESRSINQYLILSGVRAHALKGKKLPCLDIHLSSLSVESSGRHASSFSPYFSFRSVKRRDFPGNVSSGGCDSLLLVLALTSKQHDSLLGYALRFLYIRSCRLCRRCTTRLVKERSREELFPSNSNKTERREMYTVLTSKEVDRLETKRRGHTSVVLALYVKFTFHHSSSV